MNTPQSFSVIKLQTLLANPSLTIFSRICKKWEFDFNEFEGTLAFLFRWAWAALPEAFLASFLIKPHWMHIFWLSKMSHWVPYKNWSRKMKSTHHSFQMFLTSDIVSYKNFVIFVKEQFLTLARSPPAYLKHRLNILVFSLRGVCMFMLWRMLDQLSPSRAATTLNDGRRV